tara:strand:+ start:73 stop:261 length:189 start_codon:yes stop_codon:yes gene_type:complete
MLNKVNTLAFAFSIALGFSVGSNIDSDKSMHNSKDMSTNELRMDYERKSKKLNPRKNRIKFF